MGRQAGEYFGTDGLERPARVTQPDEPGGPGQAVTLFRKGALPKRRAAGMAGFAMRESENRSHPRLQHRSRICGVGTAGETRLPDPGREAGCEGLSEEFSSANPGAGAVAPGSEILAPTQW